MPPRDEGKEAEGKWDDGEGKRDDDHTEEEGKEDEEEASLRQDGAATRIQTLARRLTARLTVLAVARRSFEVGYDAETGEYFYYNKRTGESVWDPPAVFRGREPYRSDSVALRAQARLAARCRGKLARRALAQRVREAWRQDYDPATGDMYYTDRRTGAVRWDNPAEALAGLIAGRGATHKPKDENSTLQQLALVVVNNNNKGNDEVTKEEEDDDDDDSSSRQQLALEVGADSRLLMDRDSEIARLRALVEQKEAEIDEAKQSTHAELDKELRLRRMAEALKGQKRSKNLDEWRNEHVVAWFMELGLDQYAPALVESCVDGLLLLNMDEDDFKELGITKRLHQRKIDVALRKYKLRYERLQHGGDGPLALADDEDEGLDLGDSDMDSRSSSGSSGDGTGAGGALEDEDEDDLLPTEEEVLELNRDRQNVDVEVIFPGDEETFPQVGDIIRCHYTCALAATPDCFIENTRKEKRPFEFVLGIGQVILGWERGILQMSFGERSKVTVSAQYAYGDRGRVPLIPPNATLVFDLELIKWRPRKIWVKPMLQQPGLTEHPYESEPEPDPIDEAFLQDDDDDDDDIVTDSLVSGRR